MGYQDQEIRLLKRQTKLLGQICEKTGTFEGDINITGGDASEATLQEISGNGADSNTKLDTLIAKPTATETTLQSAVAGIGDTNTKLDTLIARPDATEATLLLISSGVSDTNNKLDTLIALSNDVYEDVIVEVAPNTQGSVPAGSVRYSFINLGTSPSGPAIDPSTLEPFTFNGRTVPTYQVEYESSNIIGSGTYDQMSYDSQTTNLLITYTIKL